MVSESIGTAILVIAGIILATMISVALLTQIGVIESTMRVFIKNAQEKLQTQITITLVSLNTSPDGTKYFVIYVKNTGSRAISSQELMATDVYLRDNAVAYLLTYNSSGGLGTWNYSETTPDNTWMPGETIIINAFNSTTLSIPTRIMITLPNGVSAEYQYNG